MELIDKSALVAEIESKIEKYTKRGEDSDAKRDGYGMYWGGVLSCLNEVRTLCDTLEVKEVDLDGISRHYALNNSPWDDCRDEIQDAYKAGFELGMQVRNKAQKNEG